MILSRDRGGSYGYRFEGSILRTAGAAHACQRRYLPGASALLYGGCQAADRMHVLHSR